MPYIGRDLNRGNYLKLDDISSSFNSSTTTFNLTVGGSAFTPGSAFAILVSVGGVIQEPESAYQVNNSEITFANAPTAQDSFFCIALGVALGIGVPGNGTVNGTQMAKPFNYDGYFYLDDANNRVGIGSLTPTVALDVIGNTNISGDANVSGILTALTYSGPVSNASGISTFYDLKVTNNLTVEGTTTTLDTNLIGVDRIEVGANSNSVVGVAITQSGTADILNLYDGSNKEFSVVDGGTVYVSQSMAFQQSDRTTTAGLLGRGSLLLAGTQQTDFAIRSAPHNSNLVLGVGVTERLRISSNGQTTIKSTANQPLVLNNTNTNGQSSISFQSAGSTKYNLGSNKDGDGNIDFFIFDQVNGEHRFNINASGNVGINSDSPTQKLDVIGTVKADNINVADSILHTGNTNTKISFNTNQIDFEAAGSSRAYVNNYGLYIASGFPVAFLASSGATPNIKSGGTNANDLLFTTGTGNPTRMQITSSGKIGIGSDNPGATLDLFSNDTEILLRLNTKPVKNGYLDIVSDANRRGVIRFQDSLADGGNYRWSIGNGDSDELTNTSFHISSGNSGGGAAKFVIDSNGDVGINQSNPSEKLDVVGNIKASGTVTGSSFVGGLPITNGADNRIVTCTTASAIRGETGLTYNGTSFSASANTFIVTNSSGNVTQQLNATSGDAKIVLDNSGNGNYSAIDFERERSSGAGVNGGSIFMKSDTSSNDAYLYIQAQSASAAAPTTSALSDNNGVRLILKGGDGIFSVEAGASEKLKVQTDGVLIGGHTRGTLDPSKLSVFDSSSNIGILQIHHSASGGGVENAGDLAGIAFGHGGNGTTSRPKVAIASRATGAYGRGDLCFYVDGASDNNPVSAADERLRIKTDGQIYVGSDNTNFSDAGTFFNLKNDTYGGRIGFSNNTASAGATLMEQFAYWGTNKVAGFIALGGTDTSNKDDGELAFYTRYSGASVAEALRIKDDGEIRIRGVKSGNSVPNVVVTFDILNSNGDSKKAEIKATKTADITSELIFSTTVSHAFAERLKIDGSGNLVQSGNVFAQSSANNTVISTTRTTEGVVTSMQSISNPVGRVGTTSNHSLEIVAYNNPAFTVDASGGILAQTKSFVSKFHYNPGIQATGGWSTNWNTIIPGGTLNYNDTYVITAYWQHNHNGGNANSPYLMQASFLYSSVSCNNTTAGNVEFVPFQTAHVGGGTHRLVFRFLPVAGHTTAAVQVKNPAGFHASYGGITVKAHVLSDY